MDPRIFARVVCRSCYYSASTSWANNAFLVLSVLSLALFTYLMGWSIIQRARPKYHLISRMMKWYIWFPTVMCFIA